MKGSRWEDGMGAVLEQSVTHSAGVCIVLEKHKRISPSSQETNKFMTKLQSLVSRTSVQSLARVATFR